MAIRKASATRMPGSRTTRDTRDIDSTTGLVRDSPLLGWSHFPLGSRTLLGSPLLLSRALGCRAASLCAATVDAATSARLATPEREAAEDAIVRIGLDALAAVTEGVPS